MVSFFEGKDGGGSGQGEGGKCPVVSFEGEVGGVAGLEGDGIVPVDEYVAVGAVEFDRADQWDMSQRRGDIGTVLMIFVDIVDEVGHFVGDAGEKCSFHLGDDDSNEARKR